MYAQLIDGDLFQGRTSYLLYDGVFVDNFVVLRINCVKQHCRPLKIKCTNKLRK